MLKLGGGQPIAVRDSGGCMSYWKLILPTALVLGSFLAFTTASYGKAEYAKATKKQCTFCHEKVTSDKDVMSKNLTEAGKYYAAHKSLDGFQEKK
jgi:cytochrome c553